MGDAENVETVDLATIQPPPLERPHSYTHQQCYDLGAERMRAAILAVITPENVDSPDGS